MGVGAGRYMYDVS